VLKMAESIFDIYSTREFTDTYLEKFNFENYGGTPVLGVAEPVIIGHGISKGLAFKNMISMAELILSRRLLDKIRENFHS